MPDIDLARRADVELIRTGSWGALTGTWNPTRADILAAVEAQKCPAVRRPRIKLGHTDERFAGDGEPALGWFENLRTTDGGHTLVGDQMALPWLSQVQAAAYPDRSIEGNYRHRCALGHEHPFVLTAVALLGVTPPAVSTLRSVQDLPEMLGVAASEEVPDGAQHVMVTVRGDTRPPTGVHAGATEGAKPMSRAQQIRDSWNASGPPLTQWVQEARPDAAIVVDDADRSYRLYPVTWVGEQPVFGDPEPYDPAADKVLVFASAAESRPEALVATPTDTAPPAEGTTPAEPAAHLLPAADPETEALTDVDLVLAAWADTSPAPHEWTQHVDVDTVTVVNDRDGSVWRHPVSWTGVGPTLGDPTLVDGLVFTSRAEVMAHLPGKHNQGAHGNRFKTPGNRASGVRREGKARDGGGGKARPGEDGNKSSKASPGRKSSADTGGRAETQARAKMREATEGIESDRGVQLASDKILDAARKIDAAGDDPARLADAMDDAKEATRIFNVMRSSALERNTEQDKGLKATDEAVKKLGSIDLRDIGDVERIAKEFGLGKFNVYPSADRKNFETAFSTNKSGGAERVLSYDTKRGWSERGRKISDPEEVALQLALANGEPDVWKRQLLVTQTIELAREARERRKKKTGRKSDVAAAADVEIVSKLDPFNLILPAAEPEPVNTDPKEDLVSTDLSVHRSRLGLDDTADEVALLAAYDAALTKAETPTGPSPEAVAASAAVEEEASELRTMVTKLTEQMTAISTELAAAKQEKADTVKASVLGEAKRLGKFTPADEPQWQADYDEAPGVTTRILASIAPGTAVPVMASGMTGSPEPATTGDDLGVSDESLSAWAKSLGIDEKELSRG